MQCDVMTTKERLTINFEANDFRELQRIAQQHSVSMAWLGRRAIQRFLEQTNSQRELSFQFSPSNRMGP